MLGVFGKKQIGNIAVFAIIRLERLPRCNSIKAEGIVGNSMQIATKALESKAVVWALYPALFDTTVEVST